MNIFNINGFALILDELLLYKNKVAKIKTEKFTAGVFNKAMFIWKYSICLLFSLKTFGKLKDINKNLITFAYYELYVEHSLTMNLLEPHEITSLQLEESRLKNYLYNQSKFVFLLHIFVRHMSVLERKCQHFQFYFVLLSPFQLQIFSCFHFFPKMINKF